MTTPANPMIDAALEQEPVSFRSEFDKLMAPRILDKINSLHADVAADMFKVSQAATGDQE